MFNLSHNWIKPGWVVSFGSFNGAVNNDGTMVTGSAPGFVDEPGQDYRLTSGSACVNTGGNLNPAVLPSHNVTLQYVKHRATEPRPSDAVFDIGAFEFGSGGGGNQPPVSSFTAAPASGTVPLTVNFSGAASFDPDGSITAYAWQFGDGATAAGVSASHTYNSAGAYTALLRVTDNLGATSSSTRTITVNPLAAPVLTGSASGSTVNLSWTSVSGATGYRVERKIKNGQWTVIATVSGATHSTTAPNGNNSFRVQAFNPAAASAYSNLVSFRIR
ncbi:MAG: PKD domain-containing protein [Bryobacteraceae bacterium]